MIVSLFQDKAGFMSADAGIIIRGKFTQINLNGHSLAFTGFQRAGFCKTSQRLHRISEFPAGQSQIYLHNMLTTQTAGICYPYIHSNIIVCLFGFALRFKCGVG